VIFAVGLALSGLFHRSRIFFTLLVLALAEHILVWMPPRLAVAGAHRAIFDALALLLPINVLAFALTRDAGVASPRGRWAAAFIVLQVLTVRLLVFTQPARAASLLERSFVDAPSSDWSRISQPALLAFALAWLVLLARRIARPRAVERAFLWTLVAVFLALHRGGARHVTSTYFATGGLILVMAVLQTSYSMAYRDELTDLPGRRAFNEALLSLGNSYAVGMLDIDHFKQFNDHYGHRAGDQVLRMVAGKLANVTGRGKAYRYGGEEFAVLFGGKSVEEALPCLEELRKTIEQVRFTVRGAERRGKRGLRRRSREKQPTVTVSIGVAACHGRLLAPDQVVRAADLALYRAKAKGRNCTIASEFLSS
jgi:diguanylate cyclase (GGDEF)-like protein